MAKLPRGDADFLLGFSRYLRFDVLGVFILQRYNASSEHFSLSRIKTGERGITRQDELNQFNASMKMH